MHMSIGKTSRQHMKRTCATSLLWVGVGGIGGARVCVGAGMVVGCGCPAGGGGYGENGGSGGVLFSLGFKIVFLWRTVNTSS